jgi:anti-anti-sigma factor
MGLEHLPLPVRQKEWWPEWALILPRGDLDLLTAPALLGDVLEASRRCRLGVVVDFVDCTFVDLSAVHALERAWRALRADGRRLVVRNPPRLLARMLELCGLTARFAEVLSSGEGASSSEEASPGGPPPDRAGTGSDRRVLDVDGR